MKSEIAIPFLSAVFIALLVAGVQASPGSMTRAITPSVVQPHGVVTVTISVDVVSGERYYIIDETPPSELSIEYTGELIKDANDHLKMVQLQDAADKTYTYKMKAPETEGSYTFSGIYQIDGMDSPGTIAGDAKVTVSSAPAFALSPAVLLGVVVVIIVIVVAALYFMRSKSV
jgi:hypothetical protein